MVDITPKQESNPNAARDLAKNSRCTLRGGEAAMSGDTHSAWCVRAMPVSLTAANSHRSRAGRMKRTLSR